VLINFIDTMGHEVFRYLTSGHYRGAHCVALVFDVNIRKSFDKLDEWLKAIDKNTKGEAIVIIIGNKIDIKDRKITTQEAEEFAAAKGCKYFETSCKDGTGVDETFHSLSELYVKAQH